MLTVKEVAKILKVHPITIYRWTERGKLKAVRIGRSIRIREKDLHNLIKPK